MKYKTKSRLTTVAVFAVIVIAFFGVKRALDTPIVYKSASTNECVKVDSPKGDVTCEKLPDTYDLVWVR